MKTNKSFIMLMVDDDPDDFYLMKQALSEKGFGEQLLHIKDGFELIEYLTSSDRYNDKEKTPKPGLILLDLNMPGMGGIETLKKLRAMENMKKIPVIIYTTSGDNANIQQCYREGADEYIVKPSDYEGLLHVADSIKRHMM